MGLTRRTAVVVICAVALMTGVLARLAAGRTSATFDEIILVAGGVRGLEQGRWDMVTDQPPLAMYAYGLAARGAVEAFPPEDRAWDFDQRWNYARLLFFGMNNDRDAVLGTSQARGVWCCPRSWFWAPGCLVFGSPDLLRVCWQASLRR